MELSLDYKETLAVGIDPYQQLAYAVIADACIEYREILRKLAQACKPISRTWLLHDRDELRLFFMSSWFMELAGPFGDEISGERVLLLLDPNAEQWIEQYETKQSQSMTRRIACDHALAQQRAMEQRARERAHERELVYIA